MFAQGSDFFPNILLLSPCPTATAGPLPPTSTGYSWFVTVSSLCVLRRLEIQRPSLLPLPNLQVALPFPIRSF